MSLAEDIDNFRVWATNLGCPTDALPNEDALISIFKSRQRDLFCDLQKRVQPRQYVQETRENILIKKVQNMKDKVVPACSRSFLPKEMQIHLKMEELKKKKESAKLALEENKKEFDTLSASIKTKNIRNISAQHKKKLLESKYNILQFKKEHLNKLCEREEENKAKILSTMPVKLNTKNANEQLAMNSVVQALKELEQFYQLCSTSSNDSQALQDAKQELWQKMRTVFANVPNFLIFNCIMKLKEEQLQHIMQLNKTNTNESLQQNSKEPLNAFEVKLLKTKADLLGLVAKYLSAQNEVAQLEDRFSNVYGTFVDELQKKVNNFNAITDEESTEEIISDFIVQYNMRNFNKARNEYLTQQIEQFRVEIEANAKQLENHDVLLNSIKQVYGDINTSVNRIQYEMMQLTQIKEKILYSKNMLKNMLKDLQVAAQNANAKSNLISAKLLGNNLSMSLMGVDSFEMGNDILCSTKLDFDANTSVMNSTLRRSFSGCTNNTAVGDTTLMAASGAITASTGVPPLPSHMLELNTFSEIPLEKLSCITRLSSFYLAPNPFIVESRELASTIQLAPGLLLTPLGAIKEVQRRILWASAIAAQKTDFKLNLDTIIVNSHEYKSKLKKQHEKISQLLDSIDVTTINTKHMLQKAERIYKFIIENPMRHFIPPTRTYNNLTYAEYEAEFVMYYRMATVGGSIK